MRKFISVVSIALGLSAVAGSAEATPSCVFDGTWGTTSQRGRASFTTTLTTATHGISVHRTGGGLPDARVEGTFTYDRAAGKMTITNTSYSTQDMAFYACIGVPGTYTVTFSDCNHISLSLVSDACAPRAASAGHATFTKQ